MLLKACYESFRGKYPIELIAGEAGLNEHINWFHIVENVTQTLYIHGSELVFTTGMAYNDEEWLIGFLSKLREKKACGLVINTGPYIDRIPDHVIAICDEYRLPLFTVPWSVNFVDLTRELSHMILSSERVFFQSAAAMKGAITSPGSEEYRTQLKEAGVRSRSRFCVALLSGHTDVRDDMLPEKIRDALMSVGEDVVAFYLKDEVVVVFATPGRLQTAIDFLNSKLTETYKDVKIRIGVSDVFSGIDLLSEGYRQATCALRLAEVRPVSAVYYGDLGIFKLLFSINDKSVLEGFVQEELGEVIKYDKKNNTDYLKWLRLYLECDGSVKRVVERAFCHRNTVNYKLMRLKKLVGLDIGTYAQRTKLIIAFHIYDIIEN